MILSDIWKIMQEFNVIKSVPASGKIKLAYEVFLPEYEKSLPPIILLHGLIESRKSWKLVAPVIANNTGRKVYALDLRNHGDSPWSDEYEFETMAQDLENFLNDHKIPKATVIGHSGGGRTAMVFALRKHEMVEKLIIEDMTPKKIPVHSHSHVPRLLGVLKECLNFIPTDISEEDVKAKLIELVYAFAPSKYGSKEILAAHFSKNEIPLKKVGNKYRWLANIDAVLMLLKSENMQNDLSGFYQGDALFLYGSKALYDIENDDLIPKLFPRATLMKLEGLGHYIHLENPEEFSECVSNFISDVPNVPRMLCKY